MVVRRSAILRLLSHEIREIIMVFEETAPAGKKKTTSHLHRDGDEVAHVLSGEITFRVGG